MLQTNTLWLRVFAFECVLGGQRFGRRLLSLDFQGGTSGRFTLPLVRVAQAGHPLATRITTLRSLVELWLV